MYKSGLLNAIIETITDSILVIDQNGNILLVNPAACLLFDYTADELLQKNISMLIAPPDKESQDKGIKSYQQPGQAQLVGVGRNIMAIKKNRDTFLAKLTVSTAKYNGKTIYVNVIHNLTRQGNAEERLQPNADDLEQVVAERTHFLQNVVQTLEQAREEVDTSLTKEKEVSQLKSRFVSMASHEFRTPLTNIQLSASLIECYFDKLDKQKIFDHITKIKLAVGNLTEVLNDFLSVERIEDGKASPIYREFDLLQFCEDIIDVMKIQLLQGQHITYSHLSKNKTVRLDASMLQHILVNLISNAIKYSGNNGLIEVITNIDKYSFTIQVRDNGIGIPTGDQVHLFEAFFRACNTTKIQGTGLGLNIVKRYTDLMNGTINVASSENSGTTFTLTFPVNS